MRLAFQHYVTDWAAGDWFLEGMLIALRALGADCPTLVLVVDERANAADYRALAARADEVLPASMQVSDEWTRIQWSVRRHLAWWLRHRLLKRPVRKAPHPLTDFLPRHGIDGYFTRAAGTAVVKSVPSLVWIPDFQHVRLPDMFQPDDRAGRDATFLAQARGATRVVVTAEDVASDLRSFAPDQAGKTRVLQYVAPVPVEIYAEDPGVGLARYHLPEKFFYLPNQFWQHKNHKLVFEALALLRARGVYPCVVSSGNPVDYRRPGYFSELMQMLSEANLREQFIMLGLLPRADVFRLMRQCVCVLNPSQFEGFGMSVAESKSIGKRVLVSDLGSLREQAAPGAVYFNPADAGDLAAKLEAAWTTLPPGPDRAMEAAARAALPLRQAAFGQELLDLFKEAQADFIGGQPPERQPV